MVDNQIGPMGSTLKRCLVSYFPLVTDIRSGDFRILPHAEIGREATLQVLLLGRRDIVGRFNQDLRKST